MTKFTKEQLIKRAKQNIKASGSFPGDSVAAMDLRLAEIALAALTAGMEQEPVAYMVGGYSLLHAQNPKVDEYLNRAIPLYAAPQLPQPAETVFAEFDSWFESVLRPAMAINQMLMAERRMVYSTAQLTWNACRAAMLQGEEPVSQPYKLQAGWVAVPVEATEDMVIAGFEAELREEFRDPEAWEAFEAMSGCEQAALRAKLCWAAMINAAPQQEVK